MDSTADSTRLQKDEARRYASLLDWGTRVGLVMLVLGFAAYVSGLTTPLVPGWAVDLKALFSR